MIKVLRKAFMAGAKAGRDTTNPAWLESYFQDWLRSSNAEDIEVEGAPV
jgi:hypothetical protein